MIYADTSALGKLIIAEPETAALRSWIEAQQEPLVTNPIGVVELQRLAARISTDAERAAGFLLARIDRISLTQAAIVLAAQLRPATLRTLDALHIASATELAELTGVLTYDHRLAQAAADYGLVVVAPR